MLNACPDAEWRVMFALARFGGLRTPSETLRLRWADIDWAAGRFTVTSPKTEHHEGKASRIVPLFPELLPYLREAFKQAEDGAEYVITHYRDVGTNLRTRMHRIIKRAGLTPWPKTWHNLRATRATELAQHFPQHVAAAWCGHSAKIAEEHYLQVTAEHFTAATAQTPEQTAPEAAPPPESGALYDSPEDETPEKHRPERPGKLARNPAQYGPAQGRTDPTRHTVNRTDTQGTASGVCTIPPRGVEPLLPP